MDGVVISRQNMVCLMKNAWQEQANLNYHVGGLDVFGGLMWSDYYSYDKLGLDEYIKEISIRYIKKSVGRIDSRNYGPDANLGFNYEFNENHTIGLKYKFGSGYTKYFTVRQNYSIFSGWSSPGRCKLSQR